MDVTPVTLSGPVVTLEPFASHHFEELCAAALAAPERFRYIPVPMRTRDDIRARFDAARPLAEAKAGVVFVTKLRSTGKIVGSTASLVTDRAHRRLEVGFTWLVPGARVNTEAKYLQLTHAFEAVGAIRVEFKTDSRNARSRAALTRLGAVEEGTLRSHMICWDGYVRDSVYFSVIAPEWPSLKKRLEAELRIAG